MPWTRFSGLAGPLTRFGSLIQIPQSAVTESHHKKQRIVILKIGRGVRSFPFRSFDLFFRSPDLDGIAVDQKVRASSRRRTKNFDYLGRGQAEAQP